MAKRIITEADIVAAAAAGERTVPAAPGQCIVTEQARDRALELGVTLDEGCAPPQGACPAASSGAPQAGAQAGPEAAPPGGLVDQVVAALRSQLPAGADPALVERLVREAVTAKAGAVPSGAGASPGEAVQASGVRFIESAKLLGQGAGAIPSQDKAVLAEALCRPGECGLSAGYLAWERASFKREVEAPEVGVVIEGELHLTVGGQTFVGRPGDMVYLPKGAMVLYSTPTKVTLACVNARS